MSKKLKLVSRIITLLVFVGIVMVLFKWCSRQKNDAGFTIANTPMKVEMIRSIAEIATVSYRDEVVMDSIELYKDNIEYFTGSISKLASPKDFKYGISSSYVKRRITILVKGEVRYGFDLKKKAFNIVENDSLIQVFVPNPEIVDVQVTPSGIEYFQENGQWRDSEIAYLQSKARSKLIRNAEMLHLQEQAKSNMTQILKQMIGNGKAFQIIFEDKSPS